MAVTPEPALEAPPRPEKTDAEGYPRWPVWLPLAALAIGVPFGIVTLAMLAGVLDATGVETDGDAPGITAAGTVIIDLTVVGASILLAAGTMRPRASQFGIRGGRLREAAGVAGAGVLAFFVFELVYGGIVQPKTPQKV